MNTDETTPARIGPNEPLSSRADDEDEAYSEDKSRSETTPMETDDTDIDDELLTDHPETDPAGGETEPTDDAEVVGGLSENVAGALAYFFAPLLAIVFYFVEEDNEFVRFHAVQSIIIFGGLFCLYIGLTVFGVFLDFVPVLGPLFGLATFLFFLLMAPVGFILWLVLTIKAYKGDEDGLPITGDMAKGYV